jgi:hypothetical protein
MGGNCNVSTSLSEMGYAVEEWSSSSMEAAFNASLGDLVCYRYLPAWELCIASVSAPNRKDQGVC